ncbi:hypothetical protein RB2501_03950 [Robiginitalea biformata HTCC2501]|uniref:Uncharacterized protein n=1 Tax=Robiginitalea biformata (strain ATCC BAA-864 / DSM 15991 / KCTC 12146 / HTCC2501) TaxID=313596 RepID=A4CGG0_ROBBH|nr:hypothetical protein RB2501_03950 [Robiginitalea biformata HTCC2501]
MKKNTGLPREKKNFFVHIFKKQYICHPI